MSEDKNTLQDFSAAVTSYTTVFRHSRCHVSLFEKLWSRLLFFFFFFTALTTCPRLSEHTRAHNTYPGWVTGSSIVLNSCEAELDNELSRWTAHSVPPPRLAAGGDDDAVAAGRPAVFLWTWSEGARSNVPPCTLTILSLSLLVLEHNELVSGASDSAEAKGRESERGKTSGILFSLFVPRWGRSELNPDFFLSSDKLKVIITLKKTTHTVWY